MLNIVLYQLKINNIDYYTLVQYLYHYDKYGLYKYFLFLSCLSLNWVSFLSIIGALIPVPNTVIIIPAIVGIKQETVSKTDTLGRYKVEFNILGKDRQDVIETTHCWNGKHDHFINNTIASNSSKGDLFDNYYDNRCYRWYSRLRRQVNWLIRAARLRS